MTEILKRPVAKFLYLAVLAGLIFSVPYFFPVARTVSLSYVVGYNNRVAQVIFVVGAFLFAYLVRGHFAREGKGDPRPLPVSALLVGVVLVVAACVTRRITAPYPQNEAQYSLNRLQMLASGLLPYKDFEYCYGPLQLYLPLLVSKLTHCSAVAGYYVWWGIQWTLGAAMLWVIVRYIDAPLRRRLPLYMILLIAVIPACLAEGIAYTPVRMDGSAFFLLLTVMLWQRTRNARWTALAAVACVALELCISPEQGIAVAFAFGGWLLLLTWKRRREFPRSVYGLFLAGAGLMFLLAQRMGVLEPIRTFSGGAYAFPVLPSLGVVLILFAYVVAFCKATADVLAGNVEKMSVPLVLGGVALLPAALGRCDLGHMQSAAPAFLLGVALIEGYPRVRVWWSPVVLIYFVCIPWFGLIRSILPAPIAAKLHTATLRGKPLTVEEASTSPEPPRRKGGELGAPMPLHAPCEVIYRTINVWPDHEGPAAANCLDTGYYIHNIDAFTEPTIDRIVGELRDHPRQPLLLRDLAFDKQAVQFDTDPGMLHSVEGALFVPKVKNRPLSYERVYDYVAQHYTPAPEPLGGYRVWNPR